MARLLTAVIVRSVSNSRVERMHRTRAMWKCCWRKRRRECVTQMDRANALATETRISAGVIGVHGVRAAQIAAAANNSERDRARRRKATAKAIRKCRERVTRIHAEVSKKPRNGSDGNDFDNKLICPNSGIRWMGMLERMVIMLSELWCRKANQNAGVSGHHQRFIQQ